MKNPILIKDRRKPQSMSKDAIEECNQLANEFYQVVCE